MNVRRSTTPSGHQTQRKRSSGGLVLADTRKLLAIPCILRFSLNNPSSLVSPADTNAAHFTENR